jgi:Fur family peroxide stress response transcriptional regulator
MDRAERQRRLEAFATHCRERGLPLTAQRRVILDVVLDHDGHPTADDVLREVERRLPGVSRATVYRTLDTLERAGLITRVCHPGRGVRYDRRTGVHHHLVCLRCGDIRDFSDQRLDRIEIPDTSRLGFEIVDHRVQLRGTCATCREKEEGP